jgi:hypothetical protein
MRVFARRLVAQSHELISRAMTAAPVDLARCRRTGPDGATDTTMARSATAMTLCSDRTARDPAAKAAGTDVGMMDRRRPVSAIEAEWRKRAAGVVPAQPNERPEGRHPSFQAHAASITETTMSA